MTSSIFTLSLVVVALAVSCLALPIFDEPTSTSFPVNVVEGHLPRAFTNEMELFTSTLFTPIFEETTGLSHHMMKKANHDEEIMEMTTLSQDGHSVEEETDRSSRNFEETNTLEPEMFSTDKTFVTVENDLTTSTLIPQSSSSRSTTKTTTLSPSTSSEKSNEKFVGHFKEKHEHDDDEDVKHETSKAPKKTIKSSKDDEDESESDESTTKASSAPLAEYDPTVFDSVSTPMGNQLQFDENQQSIPRLFNGTTVTEQTIEQENEFTTSETLPLTKPFRLTDKRDAIPNKLNQGEKSTITEEKKSDH